jgi:hypothetical protein
MPRNKSILFLSDKYGAAEMPFHVFYLYAIEKAIV